MTWVPAFAGMSGWVAGTRPAMTIRGYFSGVNATGMDRIA